MSGLFGSTTIKGNRITEFKFSSAAIGEPIPFGYGRAPVTGRIIFAPMPPKTIVKKKKQGKGGVKTETYTYTLSYAVAFSERIYGFWWIKRNGKVVYTQDPLAPIEDQAYATKWLQKATLYLGTEDQMPDPVMESYLGVGQVPGHRGMSLLVVEDEDVSDGGGTPATYEACVIFTPPEVYITSHPYPAFAETLGDLRMMPASGELKEGMVEASDAPAELDVTLAPTSGDLNDIYESASADDGSLINTAVRPNSGELKAGLLSATSDDDSALTSTSVVPVSGVLDAALVSSTADDDSILNTQFRPISGSLT